MKDIFNDKAKKFIDSGILKVVYDNDEYCIANVSNSVYFACAYSLLNVDNPLYGVMVNSNGAKNIVSDPSFLALLYKELYEGNEKLGATLDDYNFSTLLRISKQNENNPSSNIDLEWEESLNKNI